LRKWFKGDSDFIPRGHDDLVGKFTDRDFIRISKIDGEMVFGKEQAVQAFYEVVHITKRPCLAAVAIDRETFTTDCLAHKIGDDPAIIQAHSWTIGIEDPCDPGIDTMKIVVSHRHGLHKPLGFVVHPAWSDRIHIAEIRFCLWMDFWVAIDLRCRSNQDPGFLVFCQPKTIMCAK